MVFGGERSYDPPGGLMGLPEEISVLVVDDDEQTRNLLHSIFRSGGFEVEAAADAAEASTALRRRGAFHLAFVDVNLPGKSGLVLLREIREKYPDILVAMVSGEASVESALEATRLGAVDYIAKPFVAKDIAELANRLAAGLRQRGTQAQPRAMPSDDIGILIVDDDPSIRIILGELFQDAGYRVDDAEAVFVAVQKLARGRFDIIFSDINMPGKTGIELLRDLRHADFDSEVVSMTADPTSPGVAPSRNQPGCWVPLGTCTVPSGLTPSVPTGTERSTPL